MIRSAAFRGPLYSWRRDKHRHPESGASVSRRAKDLSRLPLRTLRSYLCALSVKSFLFASPLSACLHLCSSAFICGAFDLLPLSTILSVPLWPFLLERPSLLVLNHRLPIHNLDVRN